MDNGPAPIDPVKEKSEAPDRDLTIKIKRKYLRFILIALLMIFSYMLGSFSATARMRHKNRRSIFSNAVELKAIGTIITETPMIPPIPDIPAVPDIPSFEFRINGEYEHNLSDMAGGYFEYAEGLKERLRDYEDSIRQKFENYSRKRGR